MTFWTHGGGQKASGESLPITGGDTGSIDAFARWRVSNPHTLFDSKQIWNDPDLADNTENFPLFWDNQETGGGGTSTLFNVNRASTFLSVSANTAGTRVRQTRQRFNYQPGKSQLITLTGQIGVTGNGIIKRLGYFDDNNGVFYQDDGGIWSVVIRSSVSGSPVDTIISQSNWNLDPLNGSGKSGINLNLATAQIFFCDMEWLGVGRVRFGFFIDGIPIYCHQVLNANSLTSVYMSTPNLPIRAEIRNDGTGGVDSMEMICSTVISEGGIQPHGIFRSANLGVNGDDEIQATSAGTTYAVCGIRLKSAYAAADVQNVGLTLVETAGAGANFLWQLHYNPTLTIGLTYSDVSQSAVQFGVGAPAGDAITDDNYVLQSGYVSAVFEQVTLSVDSAIRLGSSIDGTMDEIVLSVTPITANQDILGGLTWREIW